MLPTTGNKGMNDLLFSDPFSQATQLSQEEVESKPPAIGSGSGTKKTASGIVATDQPWVPSSNQAVVSGLDQLKKLVVVVEIPSNITSKSMMEIEVNHDGTAMKITRPRPMCVSNTDNVKDALESMKKLTEDYVTSFLIQLEGNYKELRKARGDDIYDTTVITLATTVDPLKAFKKRVFMCDDGSCGLVAVFDLPVEELYDNHESDDDCIMTGGLKRKFGV